MPNLRPGTRTCIYCAQQKYFHPRGQKRDSEFNKEHVMPDAFGSFFDTLTLVGTVCTACNDQFGKSLDLSLGRGGLEGYLRYKCGQKSQDRIREFKAENIRLRLYAPDDPLWNNVEIIFDEEGERPLQAIALRSYSNKGPWIKLTEAQLNALNSIDELGLQKPIEIQLLASPQVVKERLIATLKLKGVDVPEWKEVKNIDQNSKMEYLFDKQRQRAITKIAINYLAKIYEKTVPGLIYSDDFIKAKQFVIDGTDPGYRIVSPTTPINAVNDGKKVSTQEGHLISLGFGNFYGRHSIFCCVAIYNQLTHCVTLTPNYKGILLPTRVAHYWCLDDMICRQVTPLDAETSLPLPFNSH